MIKITEEHIQTIKKASSILKSLGISMEEISKSLKDFDKIENKKRNRKIESSLIETFYDFEDYLEDFHKTANSPEFSTEYEFKDFVLKTITMCDKFTSFKNDILTYYKYKFEKESI